MKLNITLILFFLTSFSFAQTNVSGNQSGTWMIADSPYLVTGEIFVPFGQVLNIEAGVEVNFQGYYKFNVDGKLLVNGTEAEPVLFTTDNPGTGWGGIRFFETPDISVFHYCTIEYGKTSTGDYPDIHGGAVLLKESNAEFYNCIFKDNDATGDDNGMGGAVYAINTGSSTDTLTKFVDCKFLNNHAYGEGGAIKFTNDGHTEITGCEFIGNTVEYGGGAIMFFTALDVTITRCLFYQNQSSNSGGGAIKTLNPTVSLNITNCTFVENVAAGAGEGGALDLSYADVDIINSIIYNNTQTYGDEVNIGQGASATINYSDLDMPDSATGSNNLNNVNPLFVNSATGDFHLQNISPCIDSGTNVGLPFAGVAPDMGCYEYGNTAGISGIHSFKFKLYPNPNTGIFKIESPVVISRLRIFNILGERVYQKSLSDIKTTINISNLNKGTYFIEVSDENNVKSVQKLLLNP